MRKKGSADRSRRVSGCLLQRTTAALIDRKHAFWNRYAQDLQKSSCWRRAKAGRLFTFRPPALESRSRGWARPERDLELSGSLRGGKRRQPCEPHFTQMREGGRTLPPRSDHAMRLQANFLSKDARGVICVWMLFAMRLVILALFSLLATRAVASATHKRCQHEQSFCSHRCALVRDLGRLPDEAWHRCNAKCSEAFAACERRCLTRWSCGGL
jgi:hypothetical protein